MAVGGLKTVSERRELLTLKLQSFYDMDQHTRNKTKTMSKYFLTLSLPISNSKGFENSSVNSIEADWHDCKTPGESSESEGGH